MTLNDVTATSEEPVIINSTGTVDVNGGDFQTTGTKSCFVNSSANLTINKGITTDGTFASEGASCINNKWGLVEINGGTIKGGQDGILLKDLGSSGVTLTQATFEGNTNDIHLGDGQKINIKKTFTGTATILTDDPSLGRHITLENEDLSYQNKLKLISVDPHYIIGYKRGDDGVEYRYLADANGNLTVARKHHRDRDGKPPGGRRVPRLERRAC